MSNKVKNINIKSHILLLWWFYQYKKCYLNDIKIAGKTHKDILISYIGYEAIKDSKYVKIYSVNHLYLIFKKVNGYFEEVNKSKYLTLVSTNESKGKIKKVWRTME